MKIHVAKWTVPWTCCLMIAAAGARAEVRVDPMFSDHMVLQRDAAVPVWGTAAPGEKVTVAFRGQQKHATAGQDGKWIVRLDPLKVAEPAKLTVSGENSVTLQDVLAGEVWLCATKAWKRRIAHMT